MNNLPNHNSFQGVLDSIVRSYLLNELPPEVRESSNAAANIRHSSAERDLGLTQAGAAIPPEILQNLRRTVQEQGFATEVNNNEGRNPGTSTSATEMQPSALAVYIDKEYVKALHQCFEKRGVFKELQTFLRHKLVSILQDEFPSLQQSFEARDEQNITVFRLVEDFLRCHKLLYTLSVLASESDADVKQHYTKVLYGKLNAKEAEDLLDELGIKRLSRLSGQILKCYFDNEHFSLLESMHYLGVWLDGVSASAQPLLEIHPDNSKNPTRKGSGQSIILSKSNGKLPPGSSESPGGPVSEKENIEAVERRLVELERKMEQEKDHKIKEAMEKFKEEEMQKLREDLERKMKIQLVENEKNHLVEMQSRLVNINEDIHQERQGWLEVKLRQEKELCELRKQLVSKTEKKISNVSVQQEPLPSSQVGLQKEKYDNNCRKVASKFSLSNGEHKIRKRPRYEPSTCYEAIQQDKLAFLQYRLEQQDEEIKSLRRQLVLSPRLIPSTPVSRDGRGDAEQGLRGPTNENPNEVVDGKEDDLALFLRNTRKRMEKLNIAATKVDEIVQEVFARKRAATPLSSELSARVSSARNKALNELQRSSQQLLSSMTVPTSSSLVPLSHLQLPERQVTFVSPELKDLPSYTDFDIFHQCQSQRGVRRSRGGPTNYTASAQDPNPTGEMIEVDSITQGRPETPVDKQFPVSYGKKQKQVDTPPSKQPVVRREDTGKDKEVKEIFRGTPARSHDQSSSSSSSVPASASSSQEKVEESLFHMAAKNLENGSPTNAKVSTNLKEKAMRHGALSKEKVTSSDEGENDENSRSISVSESLRMKLASKSKSKELLVLRNVNGNGIERTGAISKSKVTEDGKEFPVKVQGETSLTERRQSQPSLEKGPSKIRSSSSSTSSHASRKVQGHRGSSEQKKEDDNDLSLSISAPRSEDDGNNDDFWKL